jgi:hypothetical protein
MLLLSDYLQGKHTSSLTQVDSNMCTFLTISRIKTIEKNFLKISSKVKKCVVYPQEDLLKIGVEHQINQSILNLFDFK